jgi:hypothetical protein
MQRVLARPRWPERVRALLFGLFLGVLQILLLIRLLSLAPTFNLWLLVLPGALCYLALPALAGFLTARLDGASSGLGVGCVVGGISLVMVGTAVLLMTVIAFSQPSLPPSIGGMMDGSPVHGPAEALFLILSLNGVGVLVAMFGGLIGDALGSRGA